MTPKYNPKHKKRRVAKTSKKATTAYLRRRWFIAGSIIFGVIGVSLIGIFLGKFSYDEWAEDHVQVGDEITVELHIFRANMEGNYTSGVIWNNTENPLTTTFESTANQTGIPYGLWEKLKGMKVGTIREKLWLPPCIDDLIPTPDVDFHPDAVAGDGYDDRGVPGRRASLCYSYGYDTTAELGINLRFTPIIFWVHLIALEKGE